MRTLHSAEKGTKERKRMLPRKNCKPPVVWELPILATLQILVSYYSAIGDTISCDAPCSAIGFSGKLFLRYPSKACLWIAIGHF